MSLSKLRSIIFSHMTLQLKSFLNPFSHFKFHRSQTFSLVTFLQRTLKFFFFNTFSTKKSDKSFPVQIENKIINDFELNKNIWPRSRHGFFLFLPQRAFFSLSFFFSLVFFPFFCFRSTTWLHLSISWGGTEGKLKFTVQVSLCKRAGVKLYWSFQLGPVVNSFLSL